ncbi:unnamed protein product [Amoebophrya sp. A120]|nr:unnamed protein product [Amoebophrya sp. A120]|eukprot:GSA120T00006207001.1
MAPGVGAFADPLYLSNIQSPENPMLTMLMENVKNNMQKVNLAALDAEKQAFHVTNLLGLVKWKTDLLKKAYSDTNPNNVKQGGVGVALGVAVSTLMLEKEKGVKTADKEEDNKILREDEKRSVDKNKSGNMSHELRSSTCQASRICKLLPFAMVVAEHETSKNHECQLAFGYDVAAGRCTRSRTTAMDFF